MTADQNPKVLLATCGSWWLPHPAKAFEMRGALAGLWVTNKNSTFVAPKKYRRGWPFHLALKPFMHCAPQIWEERAFYAFFPLWKAWFRAQPWPDCNVVQAIVGYATEAFDRAEKTGALKVVDCPNSHPLTYRGFWQRECDLWCPGEKVPIPQWLFGRMNRELERADLIIVQSNFCKESMIWNGIAAEKVVVNPMGVDTGVFQPREKVPSRPRFISVGTICLRKGHQYLFRAFEKVKRELPEAELICVGEYKTDFRRERPKWEGTFTHYPKLSHPELAALLQTCTAFVFPSQEEGIARAQIEALAAGLPVIGTHEGGATTLVEDGVEGFIVRGRDPAHIAQAMLRVARDGDLCRRMGEAAHKKGSVKNTWQDYGDRLLAEFTRRLSCRILERPSGTRRLETIGREPMEFQSADASAPNRKTAAGKNPMALLATAGAWHLRQTAKAFQIRDALAGLWISDKNTTDVQPEKYRRCWPYHLAMKPFYLLAPQIWIERATYASLPFWRTWLNCQSWPQANVVQAIAGFATEAFDRAEKTGALKVVDCPNSHPLTYRGFWQRECDLWCPGEKVPIPQWLFGRMNRELERADLIIVQSNFCKESMIWNGIAAEKVVVNPMGVDTGVFQPREKVPSRPRFISVGTICLRKGHQYLFRAFEKVKRELPEAELICVGEYKTDFRRERPKWEGTFTHYPKLSHPELAALLQTCTAFVFPSQEEGIARAQIEALAAGLPVIGTHEGGATTLVEDGVEGFIVRGRDPAHIAQAMLRVARDGDLCRRMGEAAHKKGSVKNTWQDYGDRLLAEYSRRLNR